MVHRPCILDIYDLEIVVRGVIELEPSEMGGNCFDLLALVSLISAGSHSPRRMTTVIGHGLGCTVTVAVAQRFTASQSCSMSDCLALQSLQFVGILHQANLTGATIGNWVANVGLLRLLRAPRFCYSI